MPAVVPLFVENMDPRMFPLDAGAVSSSRVVGIENVNEWIVDAGWRVDAMISTSRVNDN